MSRPAALKSDIGTNGLQLGDRDNQASNPELSEDSPYALGKMESVWLSKFRFLESRGYRLRPRYDPDHTHSWLNTSGELDPVVHEDIVRVSVLHTGLDSCIDSGATNFRLLQGA